MGIREQVTRAFKRAGKTNPVPLQEAIYPNAGRKAFYAGRRSGARTSTGLPAGFPFDNPAYRSLLSSNAGTYTFVHLNAIRCLTRTSPFLRAYMHQKMNNIVGTKGPTPSFAHVQSKMDAKRLKALWNEFVMDAGVRGSQSWAKVLKSMVLAQATDGRSLGIISYNSDYNLGIAIQPLPRDWMHGSHVYGTSMDVNYAGQTYRKVEGELISKTSGRTKFYEVYKDTPQVASMPHLSYGFSHAPVGETVTLPERNVMDFTCYAAPWNVSYAPEEIISMITGLSHISDLDEAMVRLMKLQVARTGLGAVATDPSKIPLGEGGVPVYGETGDDDDRDKYDDVPQYFEPGLYSLEPGQELQGFPLSSPNMNQESYRREELKNIASAGGLDYATVSGDYERVNYSSARQGVLQSRDTFMNDQANLDIVIRKFMAAFLEHCWLNGAVLLSSQRSIREAVNSPWWHRRWPWVDPQKDSKAVQAKMAMGLTSPQQVSSEMGLDYFDTLYQLKEAKDEVAKLELLPADFKMFAGTGKGEAESSVEELLDTPKELGQD